MIPKQKQYKNENQSDDHIGYQQHHENPYGNPKTDKTTHPLHDVTTILILINSLCLIFFLVTGFLPQEKQYLPLCHPGSSHPFW